MSYEIIIGCIMLVWSYLVGSIPMGVIVSKISQGRNFDIRKYGSGNIGFANVLRILGKKEGIVTILLDSLGKGVLSIVPTRVVVGFFVVKEKASFYVFGLTSLEGSLFVAAAVFLTVFGHCCSVFLKFDGGKGAATIAGTGLFYAPIATLVMSIVYILLVKQTRYMSLSNIIVLTPHCIFAFLESYFIMNLVGDVIWYPILIFTFITGILVPITHRENIQRLLKGEERKLGDKSEKIDDDESSESSLNEI